MTDYVKSVATACVSWTCNMAWQSRLYSTDGHTVTERCRTNFADKWVRGSFEQPGAAVSATAIARGSDYAIRVYCTTQGTTTEWCCDNGGTWYQGNLSTE